MNENLTTNNSEEQQAPHLRVCAVNGSASLTDAQIENQIEMDEEEDSYWHDDEEEIIGYECLGCGNVQENYSGFGCDKCIGHSLEPIYF
jgi:hypothetical protein